ncbi:MAG: branched-chain amino acid transport system II carrier protein, partial [Oscillospiraceae bacterium]
MKELKGKNLLLIGFTLFSMFFGAGNLIFPPFLGAQAGTSVWIAMAGFAVTAIGFPVLGVIAIARSGGIRTLANRVGPRFSAVFTMLIYLSIGPCLAIPRTASTSFSMAVPPFVGADAPIALFQLLYSVVFFAIALLVALRPEKLTDRLGKILCPCLLILIIVVFVGCIVTPMSGYAPVSGPYVANPAVQGFLDGYLTMDTIAA